jgi:acetate---CoA ligase (ADP-forming)
MNLEKIFNPKSIAIIGAKPDKNSVGFGLMKNVLEGKGVRKIYAVNPKRKKVMGVDCVASVKNIKGNVDLAVIAVPAMVVPKVVQECCEKKVGGMIVISVGFSEKGKEGQELQDKIVKMALDSGIPLIGPNCLGIIRPGIKLNASFAPATPNKGNIAFVSQSGALLDSAIDRSLIEKYGFSCLVSYGNEANVSLCDYLEWLEQDKQTKVICLYVEGIKEGRRFIETAKKSSKPIVVLKAGKTEEGQKTVLSHTGSLAGSYEVYKAAFKQARVLETETFEALMVMAKALSWQPRISNGIGVVTNGGGCGVLISDYCQEKGVRINELEDVLGDALAEDYRISMDKMLQKNEINGLIVVQTIQLMTEVQKTAEIIVKLKKKYPQKAIIANFLGGKIASKGIKILEEKQIPNYSDPKKAVMAISSLIK